MLIGNQKKQMSNGHSICPLPLDPMDTRKSNGQLEVHLIHLTNRMSNGLLIFPSDILHGYWTLIKILFRSDPMPVNIIILWRRNPNESDSFRIGFAHLNWATNSIAWKALSTFLLNYFIQFVFVFDLVLEKITVCSAKSYSLWELCWLSQLWVRKSTNFQWSNHNLW